MNVLKLWLLAVLALIAAAPAHAGPSDPVFVMRHLNTPAGQPDPELLPEGQRAAEALASWFGANRPVAIYVTDFKRSRATVAPLAAALHLTPIVYDPRDTMALTARVRLEHGPVLVVGHSNTVPDIIQGFGGTRPAALTHEDFGDIWRVDPDGTTTRLRNQPR